MTLPQKGELAEELAQGKRVTVPSRSNVERGRS